MWFKDKIRNLIFGLSFGLKSANDKMFVSKTENDDSSSIELNQETDSLAQALKQGVVTQEVKELRYRTYLVDQKSKDYSYVANGQVTKKDFTLIKKPEVENSEKLKIELIQENKPFESGVLDGLNRIGQYGIPEDFTLKLDYEDLPRINIHPFITQLVSKEINETERVIDLYISQYNDHFNKLSRIFLNEIEKIKNGFIKSDILNFKSIEFITNKTYGKKDSLKIIYYDFNYLSIESYNGFYILKFKAIKQSEEDLKAQFYDEIMDNKYKSKQKKEVIFDASDSFGNYLIVPCEVCGKDANKYDYRITKETYGKGMCQECLKKYLEENNITI